MINKFLSILFFILCLFSLISCGIFDRVTAEVPIEFDIPIVFDINAALKIAKLDNLPDKLPPGWKRDDIVVPLPDNLSSSIADREEIKQYANKIYNVRIESMSFIIEDNGFTQEIRNSILGIAKKLDTQTSNSRAEELVLISTLPKITPDIENSTELSCNAEEVTPDTQSSYKFDDSGNYNCEPQFDSEAASQCNMIAGGKDGASDHLKKLEFSPRILYCDPKTKTLQNGILLYIDSDKYPDKPSGNIKMKIHLKIVLRVAPLG